MNLASYLLVDAFRNDCDVAMVFSNDADLKEPIAIAKNELGIKVGVVNPHPPARRSWIFSRRSSGSCAKDR